MKSNSSTNIVYAKKININEIELIISLIIFQFRK